MGWPEIAEMPWSHPHHPPLLRSRLFISINSSRSSLTCQSTTNQPKEKYWMNHFDSLQTITKPPSNQRVKSSFAKCLCYLRQLCRLQLHHSFLRAPSNQSSISAYQLEWITVEHWTGLDWIGLDWIGLITCKDCTAFRDLHIFLSHFTNGLMSIAYYYCQVVLLNT